MYLLLFLLAFSAGYFAKPYIDIAVELVGRYGGDAIEWFKKIRAKF